MTQLAFENTINKFDRAMVCTLCGVGEPFLNPEIFNMITYAKSKRMIVEVITNGSFLSPENIDKILETGLDRITISLLESAEENYNFLVNIKRNVFRAIIHDIASLVAARNQKGAKLEIKISRILTRSDLRRAEEFIQLGIQLGVDTIIFHNLIFAEITAFELAECLFEDDQTKAYLDRLKATYEPYVQIETPTLIKKDPLDKKPSCRWYWKNACIDADGNTSGCGRFITPKPEYGNVGDTDPFNSPHFLAMRNSFIDNDILDCCKNCVESSQ
jgi:Predicted Fe-S oxidoreductases